MTQLEAKNLRIVHKLLWLAIGLLMMAEVGYILVSTFNYMVAVVGAVLVLLLRFVISKYTKNSSMHQTIMMLFPLIVIFGPVWYLIFQWVNNGAEFIGLELVLVLCFVVPILMMIYANYLIGKILSDSN